MPAKEWLGIKWTGMKFDTPFETGCIVASYPDAHGTFDGIDSDGVKCAYHLDMIERMYR